MEHLWDLLESKVWQHNVTLKEVSKCVKMSEWKNISSNETRKLILSKPKQLTYVFKHKDYPTKN